MSNTTLLTDLMIVVIPLVSAYVVNYLNVLRTTALMAQAVEIVKAGVVYTSQTFVDSLKREGKFDVASQKLAFRKTFDKVEPMFNARMKKFITDAYGDFETWLKMQIEATVYENKKQ